MKGLKTVLAVAVVLGVLGLSVYGAEVKTPSELLQEGIYAEETEGNLDAAIEKYEQVLDSKRAYLRTAAQATYRIGMCYLKKGEKDTAGKYFREVVDKYPKQRSVAALAQAELEKLGPRGETTSAAFQKAYLPDAQTAHVPVVLDLASGEMLLPRDDNKEARDFIELGKGDIGWDKRKREREHGILGCARGAKVTRWDDEAIEYFELEDVNLPGVTTYRVVKIPCNLSITKANGEEYEVKILSERDEGINIEYRRAGARGEEVSLYDELPPGVINYIGGKYGVTCAEAGVKQMYANGRIYYVNNEFVVKQGGMGYYYNFTGQPASGRLKLGETSYPDQTHYDVAGRKMETEIVPAPGRKDHYYIFWTPKEPIAPAQFFSYGWSLHAAGKLSPMPGADKYMLIMQNQLGTHGVETFFLVIPVGMTIESQTTHWTGNATFAGHEVYWWTEEVQPDSNHVVNVVLGKGSGAGGGVRKAHLPDVDTRGVPVVLDLSTGEMLVLLDLDGQIRDFVEVGKGDLAWDRALICFRDAKAQIRQKGELEDLEIRRQEGGITSYKVDKIGSELVVSKANGEQYEVTIVSATEDGSGINIEYRLKGRGGPVRTLDEETLRAREIRKKSGLLATEGWRHVMEERYTAAEMKLKEAVELDPNNEYAWLLLGSAQLHLEKHADAKDSYEKCLALDATSASAMLGLASLAKARGDIDEAIEWCEKALKSAPRAQAALENLAEIYMERGEYTKAAKHYRALVLAMPGNKAAVRGLEKAEKMSKEK